MNSKSGEVLTAVLVGLALGITAAIVHYNGYAQERANATGMEFGVSDYLAEKPLVAIGLPLAGAGAGWGIGALLDDGGDKEASKDVPDVTVVSGRDSTVVISGRDGTASNDQSQPTTTTAPEPAP